VCVRGRESGQKEAVLVSGVKTNKIVSMHAESCRAQCVLQFVLPPLQCVAVAVCCSVRLCVAVYPHIPTHEIYPCIPTHEPYTIKSDMRRM